MCFHMLSMGNIIMPTGMLLQKKYLNLNLPIMINLYRKKATLSTYLGLSVVFYALQLVYFDIDKFKQVNDTYGIFGRRLMKIKMVQIWRKKR